MRCADPLKLRHNTDNWPGQHSARQMTHSAPQPLAQSAIQPIKPTLSAPHTDAKLIHIEQFHNPAGEGSCHFPNAHTLSISLASRPLHYLHRQDGQSYTGLYSKGEFIITPADVPLFARWEGEENFLQIRLNTALVRQVAQETLKPDCDRLELQPTFRTRDPQIEAIAHMLLAEQQQNQPNGQLYLDSLANVLVVQLLRQHATVQTPVPTYAGGLPQHQLKQVLDYIDAHLDQDLKLTNLAQLLDMSQFHFSRLFKQSLGRSPHQYLLGQRIERAKQLLKQTDQSILDIALASGFNSHSHLSRQFRQLTGMTPKAYRAR